MPAPSWQPPLIAFGLAAVLASLFTWWPYGVIGGVIALFALFAWIRDARAGYSRLPRQPADGDGGAPRGPAAADRRRVTASAIAGELRFGQPDADEPAARRGARRA